MTQRSVTHASFVIERSYGARPARVFAAWTTPDGKAAWFGRTPGKWTQQRREFDFRVGGREQVVGAWTNGPVSAFDCVYQDIVEDQRIVYSYIMRLDDKPISVSLATVEFKPDGAGTRLVFTEQAAFLHGYDDAGSRENGTAGLLDRLGVVLGRPVRSAP